YSPISQDNPSNPSPEALPRKHAAAQPAAPLPPQFRPRAAPRGRPERNASALPDQPPELLGQLVVEAGPLALGEPRRAVEEADLDVLAGLERADTAAVGLDVDRLLE